jgi:caffeoyl-CoA O-methyltransferase
MEFLAKDLEEYCSNHSSKEDNILKQLYRETHTSVLNPRMISSPLQGHFLSMISRMLKPKNILEIGTYTGYSAICLAKGLPIDGALHTIDINEELKDISAKYIDMAGFKHQIIQHTGDACDVIPKLNESFDLVFIDADKKNYPHYFKILIDQLKTGAWIIADNVLWSGKVLNKVQENDSATKALIEYNDMINNDPRVENFLLPIRDGLMISRKV